MEIFEEIFESDAAALFLLNVSAKIFAERESKERRVKGDR